jgi:hypothetical protein
MASSYHGRRGLDTGFGLFLNPFLQTPGLPFAEVLSEEEIEEAFDAEGISFGETENAVYTPPITLWAFLSQMIFDGELGSCTAAVARVVVLLVALGQKPPSGDSGAYCRARAKLPEKVIERLSDQVADGLEDQVPLDWLWRCRHVKLVDGTTLTMPDTKANQKAYPQSTSQKKGLGFPILRMVVLMSLVTAAACGVEFGPYKGKETGEAALLRTMLDKFYDGDIVLADRYYCSHMMLALLLLRGVDSVMREREGRRSKYRRGCFAAKGDQIVVWKRPQRPEWMDADTYATIPKTLTLRRIQVEVHEPGFRPDEMVIMTTLTNTTMYPTQEIADLYRCRWHVELDLRTIKSSMNMDRLRCKSPAMVHKEIRAHWLAYNLIRKTMAQAALSKGVCPRQISFACARQAIAASWATLTTARRQQVLDLAEVQFRLIASHPAGHRPNRVEPRAVKRRPKPHRLLTEPRAQARAKLLAGRGKRR